MSQGLGRRIFLYLLAVLVTAALAVMSISVMASVGAAQDEYKKPNSGSGNISETCPPDVADCDPGQSGGKNQGGD